MRRSTVRWRRGLAGAVAVAVLPVVAGLGGPARALAPTPRFAPLLSYGVGSGRAVATGDFTGDGRNDVVMSTQDHPAPDLSRSNHVYLFVQGGDGWFARIDTLPASIGYSDQAALAAGDFDGDGGTDAALTTGRSVDLFLQRAGTLVVGPSIPVPGAQQVVAADLDGDRRPDLVVNGTGGVAVLRNLGGGAFSTPVAVTPDGQAEVAVGDVTGDGRPDLATCSGVSVLVFAQLSDGTFAAAATYPRPLRCVALAIGDVNGDGRLDVAVVGGGNRPGSRLDVLPQRADGTLGAAEGYRTGDIPGSVKAGDMNADGRTDLVVHHEGWMSAGVHAQAPDHTLDPERSYTIPLANNGGPGEMALGDINGDGRPDIVIADDVHGLIVLWGQPPGPSTTTSSSVLPPFTPSTLPPGSPPAMLSGFQGYSVGGRAQSLTAGDFNGDGRTDVAMTSNYSFDLDTDYKLFVFLQGPNGSFDRFVRFDTDGAGSDVLSLAAGDLDGDGKTDLVLGLREGIDVYMQRNGSFADRKFLELPAAGGVNVADLDRDGKADLVLAATTVSLNVYRSLGAAVFAAPVVVSTGYQSGLVIGDVTGDGRPDLVTGGSSPGVVVVNRQLPDGTFTSARYPTGGDTVGALDIGDLTGDGRMDVALSDKVGIAGGLAAIKVLPQLADGTLGPAVATAVADPQPVKVADIDGDGRADVVITLNGGPVGVMRSLGDGRLAPPVPFETGASNGFNATSMVVADLTGDGRPDVALADMNAGLIFLRNLGAGVVAPTTSTTSSTTTTSTTPSTTRPTTTTSTTTARVTTTSTTRPSVTDQARYVDRVYRDLLGRPATSAETATWSPSVGTAAGRVNLGVALVGGREFRTRLVAADARAYVGGSPDPVVSSALVDAMAKGAIDEISAAYFLGSGTFYTASGSTPETFIDALYARTLGTAPDPAARAALAGVLRSGYSRTSLAVSFLIHPVARGRQVDGAYQHLLGHAADPTMRAFWVDALAKGSRSEHVSAWLISTDEYWRSAVAP